MTSLICSNNTARFPSPRAAGLRAVFDQALIISLRHRALPRLPAAHSSRRPRDPISPSTNLVSLILSSPQPRRLTSAFRLAADPLWNAISTPSHPFSNSEHGCRRLIARFLALTVRYPHLPHISPHHPSYRPDPHPSEYLTPPHHCAGHDHVPADIDTATCVQNVRPRSCWYRQIGFRRLLPNHRVYRRGSGCGVCYGTRCRMGWKDGLGLDHGEETGFQKQGEKGRQEKVRCGYKVRTVRQNLEKCEGRAESGDTHKDHYETGREEDSILRFGLRAENCYAKT